MTLPRIRALALCVFHHQGKILVHRFDDPVTGQTLFRPVGGGIEFGETSAQAIMREVQEELDQAIEHLHLVGTLESLFTYNNIPGHEIVQIYDGQFRDQRLYQMAYLTGHESDGMAFQVTWQDSSAFTATSPLVPEGLYPLLKNAGLLD